MLRFVTDENIVILEIKDVFDWKTLETSNFTYALTQPDFDTLIGDLIDKEYASLEYNDGEYYLSFEWRLADGRIQFRLEGRTLQGLQGFITHRIPEFHDLILNDLNLQL